MTFGGARELLSLPTSGVILALIWFEAVLFGP